MGCGSPFPSPKAIARAKASRSEFPTEPANYARCEARGAAAGFDARALGGHSLKRGAMNTAKDRRVHPTQLKQLGRHKSYATLSAYIEEGDLFEDNALNGVL